MWKTTLTRPSRLVSTQNNRLPIQDFRILSRKIKQAKLIVVQDTDRAAPNISLNAHGCVSFVELWLAAAIGSILQLFVLGYAGYTAYSATTPGFITDDRDAASAYAYPCMAAGTVMLVAGMLVCAHVVESGSEEVMYRVKLPRMQARLIWLQKEATVNDQSFRPFAICARNSTQYYTTLRRRPETVVGGYFSLQACWRSRL